MVSATRQTRRCWPACGSCTPRRRGPGWRPLQGGPPWVLTFLGNRLAPRYGGCCPLDPQGSVAGPSGLRPQHLLDCLYSADSAAKTDLLGALLTLVTTVSAGRLHPCAAPHLCAARLVPLRNDDGGVRLILVGDTLRRLTAKCMLATSQGRRATAALAPLQTDFAQGRPCEVVAMGVQAQSDTLHGNTGWLLLQVDLKNDFNSIHRRPSWTPRNDGARPCCRG